jgi:cell wall-associated NlpC family hydrolase
MSAIEKATQIMESWANDSAHGYDQVYRWGEKGDYDCSSAVISAWELAGVPVKTKGATYTGNMYSVFIANGFEDITAQIDLAHGIGLKRGDVLLNHKNHTAMYAGGGNTVEAFINEYGTTTGGQPGDQTGKEFVLRLYRNYPWDCVLRYTGAEATKKPNTKPGYYYSVKLPLLREGMEGKAVRALQELLIAIGYLTSNADGIFGVFTRNAVMGFQADRLLDADGEVGGETWAELINNYGG